MVDMADKARMLLRGLLREFRHLGDGQLKRNITVVNFQLVI